MPTAAEQKALAFVALIVLLGGAVRVVRGGNPGPSTPTTGEQQALARQSFAASSSATSNAGGYAGRGRKGRRVAREKYDTVAGKATDVRGSTERDWRGLPPPSPRIDMSLGSSRAPADPLPAMSMATRAGSTPIDVDVATVAELEALPRVGPALSRRIVANRDSLGPFRNLEALRRVRGVGPATLKLLAPLVTFSGQTRR